MKTSSPWRHMYSKETMDNKFFICENINIFGYLGPGGGRGALIIRLGPSWFTSTLSFNNNWHVKYRSNLIRIFWVKIKKYEKKITICFVRGSCWALTYVQQGENNLKTNFFMYEPKCKKYIFGLFRGLWWGLQCFPAILSPISMYMSNTEAIWLDMLSLTPKYEKYTFFSYLGVPGWILTPNPGKRKFQGINTSSQIRHM